MRPNLVVLRCGRATSRPAWAQGPDRTFDLVLCPYEEVAPGGDRPDLVRTFPGQKWAGLARFLAEEDVWRGYERVWLPDDDLGMTGEQASRFLDLCRRRDAALAAPALTQDSHHSHLVTLANRAFVARETTFVEVMAPCFRHDVLERLRPTLEATRTGYGWGLDDAWARLLEYRGIWVFDDVAVRHDRPVGARMSDDARRAAKAEMRRTRARYDACSLRKTVAGHDAAGVRLDERDPRFLGVYLDGLRDVLGRDPDTERRIRRDQAKDAEAWLAASARRGGRRRWAAWWPRRRDSGASLGT